MLEIIGAGWGRTGTSSTKQALDKLGYNTYHMTESIKNKDHQLWMDAYDGERPGASRLLCSIPTDARSELGVGGLAGA